jgi:hypothetical protein
MKAKTFCFYLMAVVLGGCVPVLSLHPLYTKEDIQFKEELLGIWADGSNDTMWEFKPSEESEAGYELVFTGESEEGEPKGLFVAHLVKLEDKFFLDIYPANLPGGDPEDPNTTPWPYNMFFFLPAHTFLKVEFIGTNSMKVLITDDDKLGELLGENPNAIRHEVVEDYDGNIVLTASTKELQAFVMKYAEDERVFSNEIVLHRKKDQEPTTEVVETIEPIEEVKD